MSSGSQRKSFFVREEVAGVTPSNAQPIELKRTSFGLNESITRNDSDEIGRTRMAERQSYGAVDFAGDIGTLFRNGNLDDFLASVFGNDWSDNGLLEVGNERITFSVYDNDADVGVHKLWKGERVNQLQLTIPNDGDITATVSMMGLDSVDNAGSDQFYSDDDIVDAPSGPQFSFKNVRNLRIDGEALENDDGTRKACVDNFNLTFDNNAQTQRCIGTGTGNPGAVIFTRFQATGTIVLSWSAYAYEMWRKNKDQESISFQFDVHNQDGGYRFYFPKLDLSGDWPDGGATDIIQVSLDISAFDESPTIQKLEVDSRGDIVEPDSSSE